MPWNYVSWANDFKMHDYLFKLTLRIRTYLQFETLKIFGEMPMRLVSNKVINCWSKVIRYHHIRLQLVDNRQNLDKTALAFLQMPPMTEHVNP